MLKLLIDTGILSIPYVLGFLAAWSPWVVMDLPAGGQLAKSILKSPCRSGTRAPSGSGRAHDSTACPFHIATQQQRSAHPRGGQADLAVLKGPGCVRHVWLLPGKKTNW